MSVALESGEGGSLDGASSAFFCSVHLTKHSADDMVVTERINEVCSVCRRAERSRLV